MGEVIAQFFPISIAGYSRTGLKIGDKYGYRMAELLIQDGCPWAACP